MIDQGKEEKKAIDDKKLENRLKNQKLTIK